MNTKTNTPINLNTVEEKTLAEKLGISLRLAKRIIDFRPYRSIDQLNQVWGLDEATKQRILPFVSVNEPEAISPGITEGKPFQQPPTPPQFERFEKPSHVTAESSIPFQRRLRDIYFLLAAIAIGAVAIIFLRLPWAAESQVLWPWMLLVISGMLGGWALHRIDVWQPDPQPLAQVANGLSPNQFRRKELGFISLFVAGLLITGVVIRLWPDYNNWSGTVFPWLMAMALVMTGSLLLKTTSQPENAKPSRSLVTNLTTAGQNFLIPHWLEIAGFLVIAALAIFLRIYRIHIIPSGIYVDETNSALDALSILEGNQTSPFATGWYGTPNGYIFYMAFLIKLIGANLTAIRAISLIPAILTVLAIYPLGRLMFGPLGGLAAMLFMAVSRWHLSMSRWGWNEVAPLLFQIGATYFLIRGLRERRAVDFTLGGLITGLMMYTYLSSRLAIATLAVFIFYYLLADPAKPINAFKRHWTELLLLVFAFCVAFAPLAVTHITDPFTFNNRVNEISVFKDIKEAGNYTPLWLNVQDYLKYFHQTGDHQGKHNLPDEPQTDPFTGLLFVIGLGYAIFCLRDRRRGLLWFWLLLGMAGGVLSSHFESPQSYRTLSAVPAIALLAGDALSRITLGVSGLATAYSVGKGNLLLSKLLKVAWIPILVIGLGGAAVWESSVYFGRQANSVQVQAGFNLVENQVAQEVINALKSDTPIYVSPRFYGFSPLRYLVYGVMKKEKGINVLDDWPFELAHPEQEILVPYTGHAVIFLLDLNYQTVANYFKNYYPHSEITTVKWTDELSLYVKVFVPQADLAALQGLQASYSRADGSKDERVVPQIDEDWSQKDIRSATWSGHILLPRSGDYDFTNQGNLVLQLGQQEWNGSKFLCRGLHEIVLTQADSQSAGLARLGWNTPDGEEDIISPQVFFHLPQMPLYGLTGYYYENQNWEGEPVCQKLTPFFLLAWPDQDPFQDAFSARFKGFLNITKPGLYRFRIEADDGARLILDGQVAGEGMLPNQPNRVDVQINLSAGMHPIQIDYFQSGGGSALEFYWQPPDENEYPVPPEALTPELP